MSSQRTRSYHRNQTFDSDRPFSFACTILGRTCSSQVLGMTAMVNNHVAVNVTPFPASEFSTHAQHPNRYEPLSKLLTAPQLHATKPPTYPKYGVKAFNNFIAGRAWAGTMAIGTRLRAYFSAVVSMAARLAPSSCLLSSISSTGGGR